jgi:hypothetical protein
LVILDFYHFVFQYLGYFGHSCKGGLDFGVMYHHDYSALEAVGGIRNHLCILVDDLVVVPEAHFLFILDFLTLCILIFGLFWA